MARSAKVKWLGTKPSTNYGATFGLPWPQKLVSPNKDTFICKDDRGQTLPLDSRVIAYWPDGSVKWTSHSLPATSAVSEAYTVHVVAQDCISDSASGMAVDVGLQEITVDTGRLIISFPKSGPFVVSYLFVRGNSSIQGHNHSVAVQGRLILQSQDRVADHDISESGIPLTTFNSRVDQVFVEQNGHQRVVVQVRGMHEAGSFTGSAKQGERLPFTLRFYLYARSDTIRLVHTIVYDGDQGAFFIRGIGLKFEIPLWTSSEQERYVRMAGVDGGVFSEASKPLTGLWRDPGAHVRKVQIAGKALPALSESFGPQFKWVPHWNDFSLQQLSPDGFTLKKRTKPGQSWVKIPAGTRAGGLVWLGCGEHGGLAMGMRHFWERYPTSIDVRGAAEGQDGEVILWLYSPAADAMDMRPYHDGLGQSDYDDQLDAMKITYEDWEPKLGSPHGIARTNEIFLFGRKETPSNDEFANMASLMRNPPVLVASPEYLRESLALGSYWKPRREHSIATDHEQSIENNLEFLFRYYSEQIEQRRWYGFWDHGDIMHTYDADRHTWRYDIGGYAWDNSELSPDLWLWQYFLHTGREDVYRLAEALTRHTSEVDAYHLGPFKGLGTRHGVQHWGDSCKQARVTNALYKRTFYYISGGDERTGDLLEENLEAEKTFLTLDPYRKVRQDRGQYTPDSTALSISLGTDWSALAASWFLEWERRGPHAEQAKAKLLGSMRGIGAMENGFVTGTALYNMTTGFVSPPTHDRDNKGAVKVSHLSAMFGLMEICTELIETLGDELSPAFEAAWLDYCRYFNASEVEQVARYGVSFGKLQLHQGHSRLTAYAAARLGDSQLRERAWKEFYSGDGYAPYLPWKSENVKVSAAVAPVTEATWVSTNITSLYGLAAIQNMALLSDVVFGDDADEDS